MYRLYLLGQVLGSPSIHMSCILSLLTDVMYCERGGEKIMANFDQSYVKSLVAYMRLLGAERVKQSAILTGVILAKHLDFNEQQILGNAFIVAGSTLTTVSQFLDEANNKGERDPKEDEGKGKGHQIREIQMGILELQKQVVDLKKMLACLPEE